MKYVTLTLLILTACGSNTDPNVASDDATQPAENPFVAPPTPCPWSSGSFIAPLGMQQPTTTPDFNFMVGGTVSMAASENMVLPSSFTPFTAELNLFHDPNSPTGGWYSWVHYVSGDTNETISCPEYIDNGAVKLTFFAATMINQFGVDGTYTQNGNTQQVVWGN